MNGRTELPEFNNCNFQQQACLKKATTNPLTFPKKPPQTSRVFWGGVFFRECSNLNRCHTTLICNERVTSIKIKHDSQLRRLKVLFLSIDFKDVMYWLETFSAGLCIISTLLGETKPPAAIKHPGQCCWGEWALQSEPHVSDMQFAGWDFTTDLGQFCLPEGRMELCARLQGLTNDERAADISRLQWRVSRAASKLRMTSFVLEGIFFTASAHEGPSDSSSPSD